MKYYVIKDTLVGFLELMPAENEDVAIRRFKQVMNNPNFKENKADYQLWYVGDFNQLSGIFTTNGTEFVIGGENV